ncbi:MAG: LuxR family transcriptional regulator [Gallionella sp.]|nr:LuxR family transcriptional regulator [Gallionella sp.]
MESIERFTALLECKTEGEWLSSVLQLGSGYGFEHTLIALAPSLPTTLGDFFLRGNVSKRWIEIYDSRRFINIDPVIAHCITRSTPVLWESQLFSSKEQKAICKAASRFGLRSGISLPFHGANGEVGVLCLARSDRSTRQLNQDILHIAPELSLMCDYVFQAALRFASPTLHSSAPSLSQREMECLMWCATGKSSWEIAQILKCTESTVNFHILNLRRKLHATSRRQAVVNAIHCGLLPRVPKIHLNNLLYGIDKDAKVRITSE